MHNIIYPLRFENSWRYALILICTCTLFNFNAQFYVKGIFSVSATGSVSVFENNFIAEPTSLIINNVSYTFLSPAGKLNRVNLSAIYIYTCI